MYQFNIFDYAAVENFCVGCRVMSKDDCSIGLITGINNDNIIIKFPDKVTLVSKRFFKFFFVIYDK